MGPLVVLYDGRTATTGTPSVTLNTPVDTGTTSTTTPTLAFTGVTSTGDQNISYEIQIDTATTFDSNSPTPAFVQSATPGTNATGSTSTTATGAFASANTVHNAIIVGAVVDSTSAATNVTDTAGNTYTLQAKYPASGNRYLEIWACFDIKAQASNVVTYTQGFNDGAVFAHEYSGLYGIVDQTASGTATNASPTATTAATTYAHQLVFSIMEMDVFSSDVINSAGTGYSNFQTGSSNSILGAVESKVVSATGTQTATFNVTNAGGASWRLLMVTFPAIAPLIDASSNVNAGFADITNGAKTDPFPSSNQIGYTVQSALTNTVLYYWRVKEIQPTNNVNYLSGWSATHSFTVSSSGLHTTSLSGALSFTGAQVKRDTKALTGGLSFTGAFTKKLSRSLTAALSFTGNLARKLARSLTAILSFTGAFTASHLFSKVLSATLSFTGSINRRTTKSLTAALSFTGALIKFTRRALSAGLSFTGSLTKRISRAVAGALSFAGTVATVQASHFHFIALSASLSFSGGLNRRVSKVFTAGLSFVGTLLGFIPPIFTYITTIISGSNNTSTSSSANNSITASSNDNTDNVNSQNNTTTLNSDSNNATLSSEDNDIIL